MRVFEIFRSIQGETTRVGLVMWFVRVAGCDLSCVYCDTPEARRPDAGREMSVPEILDAVARPPLPYCMITGGEPLLQLDEVNALAAALIDRGCEVLIETSGAHPIEDTEPRARRIVDIKTPGSGMAGRNYWLNLERLTESDEAKFVLTDRRDYEWAKDVVARHRLLEQTAVLFGPARGYLGPNELARWIVEDGLPVRLNLQIHKSLGLP